MTHILSNVCTKQKIDMKGVNYEFLKGAIQIS